MATTTVRKEDLLSPRVKREKEALLSAEPQLGTERSRIMLDVYQNDGTDPNIVRRAKVFHRLCSEKTIFIDNNPIVGTLTKYPYGAYIFPEEGNLWMGRTDEIYTERGKAAVTPEVREWVDRGLQLWRNSNLFSVTCDIIGQSLKVDARVMAKCGLWSEITPQGARHMIFPDYPKVVNKGLNGLLAEVEEAEAELDVGETDGLDRYNFYQAAKLSLNAMITLSQRYASLAREMAEKEKDAARKQELEEIARICEWVPANPARNFREAIQAFWFVMLGAWLEAPGVLSTPPNTFTLCLYPFYKKDKEAGEITSEEAIELTQFFFLQCNRLATTLSPHGFRMSQTRLGLQLSLGAFTPDGEDATTELDYLVLEAQHRLQMPEPLINVVYHDKLSEEFLLKCIDLVRTGIGQPAFHNGYIGIERHLYHHHMPLEQARSLRIIGCVQTAIPGYTNGYWYTRFNVAKMIEFVLENGQDPLTGMQLGLQTGDADSFKTYDEFYQALVKQLEYFIPLTYDASRIGWSVQRNFPTPFASTTINDCIKQGKDVSDGGARYSSGDG
ncbi:pyruvate formate lyase family protein, partial [Chloroflexota bacterium]